MELYSFQAEAAESVAERTVTYLSSPITVSRAAGSVRVPWVQFLSSITASGKTLILAEAATLIAKQLPVPPVILWMSKGTVVVEQSFANLDVGGMYHELLQDTSVRYLSKFDTDEIEGSDDTFLYFATTGTFNRGDKTFLKVHGSSLDDVGDSTIWDELKRRPSRGGYRRPLLITYDEAHNLSDQQTSLLLELEPDAFILATATARMPARFNTEVVQMLKTLGGYDDDLTTSVDSKAVAETGLIKTELELIGRQAPAAQVISEMLASLEVVTKEAAGTGLPGKPKAVYVCKTNVVEGSDETDNASVPFAQRQAPPILIWRQLVEKHGVDPSEIAVYAKLTVKKDFPMPEDFVLFSGGDNDYDAFVAGDYRHVIFNKSLQEGWDEPLVYVAYIDKSMGSKVETKQVVGRLLRQPGRVQYAASRLNRAEIWARVDSAGVFGDVVDEVQSEISAGNVPITFAKTPPGSKPKAEYPAKGEHTVPLVAIRTDHAEEHIAEHLRTLQNYLGRDDHDTRGVGRLTRVQRRVGGEDQPVYVWEEVGESARVIVRWLYGRDVRRIHPGALGVSLTANADGTPSKFDALVGLGSNAAVHVADIAAKVGHDFVERVYLKLRKANPYTVGPILQSDSGLETFSNSVHAGYSGLNPSLELPFARALDRCGRTWARNPSQSGYRIPLVQPGKTTNFFPDFLVWSDDNVYAIDTKGSHLHNDAMRKLVSIKPADGLTTQLYVRFVSDGQVDESGPLSSTGYTTWRFLPSGNREFVHVETMDEALSACLTPDL